MWNKTRKLFQNYYKIILINFISHVTTAKEQYWLSVEGRPPRKCIHVWPFCSCDLDIYLANVIYELDLHILYLRTKNEVSRSLLLEVRAQIGQTDRQRYTDRRNRTHYHAAFADDNLLFVVTITVNLYKNTKALQRYLTLSKNVR